MIYFYVFIICILFQTNCVPPPNDAMIAGTKTIQRSQKGLNYQSMIETFSVRLCNRFQTKGDSAEKIKSERLKIYITSLSIQQSQLSQLNQMIIKDLKKSFEKKSFIVQIPPIIDNPAHPTVSECESRQAILNQDIKIILSTKPCDSMAGCILIILDVSYQGKTATETCHLALTPDLVQKKNDIYHIPAQLGHMKRPFRDLELSAKYIAETMHCLFNALLSPQKPHRLLFAKTDHTQNFVVESIIKQWRQLIGEENIAQTIIPIDCYSGKFVIREKKISESIPEDIPLLISIDSIEIYPGKFRIRVHALSLKTQLVLPLKKTPSISFGTCLPGSRFHLYTYTKSKGSTLSGEGSGDCARDMPQNLWSYSAKTLAERSAKQTLTRKIKNYLRKHYIANDQPYNETMIDNQTQMIMKNAILEWEQFDEKICIAEARFVIHDSFLPFELSSEPQAITKQEALVGIAKSQPGQTTLTQTSEPQAITKQETSVVLANSQPVQETLTQMSESQSITKQNKHLIQLFNRSLQKQLTIDNISQSVVQMIQTVGSVQRKECVSVHELEPKQTRCRFAYELSFVFKGQHICRCKGSINGVGNSVETAQKDGLSALRDLLYPFPLDIALALNNKLSMNDLKQMLKTLDKKYFQLLENIDVILEFIQSNQISG